MKNLWTVTALTLALIFSCTARAQQDIPEATASLSWSEFKTPSKEYRPWTRWWWPGNNVEDEELEREINLLADKYYGGVEIQSFTMGLDPESDEATIKRRMSFDSPSFYKHVETVMGAARDRGLQVDLTLGSGWPSGGAHLSSEQNLETMLFGERQVRGPRTTRMKIPGPKKPVFYYIADFLKLIDGLFHTEIATYLEEEAELMEVVAGKIVEGRRSWNPANLSDSISLDSRSLQVLTDKVEDGRLHWNVPKGRWIIVAIYRMPNGERPTLTAQSDPGFVLDHLDRQTTLYHLQHLLGERTGLESYYGGPFRAFFNDSFEFKCERHVTEDFRKEFKKRRGYDVSPYLPLVLKPGADNFFFEIMAPERKPFFDMTGDLQNAGERVRYDYSLTVSDLFLERYLKTSRQWAEKRGLMSRVQGYGMDMDIIRASGQSHIPETEQLYAGGSEMFLKIASSAGNLYNRPIVSAESMVWSGRDYMTTPLKIKASADKLFASGINQIIYHGFTYRKDHHYGETGWYPWSSPYMPSGVFSSNLSPANPFFKYMERLNLYIARCQYLLREAKPRPDLLVYYPFLGLPSGFSAHPFHKENLFNGHLEEHGPEKVSDTLEGLLPLPEPAIDPRSKWLADIWPLLESLERAGYTWQWVNDHSLAEAGIEDGNITIRGKSFKGLLLAEAPWLPTASARRLKELSEKGAPMVIFGKAPGRQPGFHNYRKNDRLVAQAMEAVKQNKNTLYAEGIEVLLKEMKDFSIRPSLPMLSYSLTIDHAGFEKPDGTVIHFFSNPEDKTLSFTMKSMAGCNECFWLDPWRGKVYNQHMRGTCACVNTGPLSNVTLRPHEALFLVCPPPDQTPFPGITADSLEESYVTRHEFFREQAKTIKLEKWLLEVRGNDVKDGKVAMKPDELKDWREIDTLRYSSSPGIYSNEFSLDLSEVGSKSVELELGKVAAAAEVKINGHGPIVLLVPPFRADITKYLRDGKNYATIKIVPPLRNRFIGKARKGDKLYKQFKNKEETLLPAGLIGPVRLLIFSKEKVLK